MRFAAVLLGTSLLMRVTSPMELSDAAVLVLFVVLVAADSILLGG